MDEGGANKKIKIVGHADSFMGTMSNANLLQSTSWHELALVIWVFVKTCKQFCFFFFGIGNKNFIRRVVI